MTPAMPRNTDNNDTAVDPNVNPATGEITEDVAASMVLDIFKESGALKDDGDSPEAIQQRIVQRIFESQSIDELFGQWEMLSSDQLEGRTFTITRADFDLYTPNEGGGAVPLAKVYATEDDRSVQFITTAPNLTAFIAQCDRHGWLPFTAKIVGSKTRRGFTSLHFERA